MDESALRILLNNLEVSRSSLHGLLHIFTSFVVIGLAFDLFVIIKEFRDDWREFRYGQIHPYDNHSPKRPSVSLLILALLGTALIVIGVAGEQYVDVQAGKIETQIREANDKRLGLITQEAGDAAESAKIAHEEADAASKASGKALDKSKEATDKAGDAQEKAREVATLADETNRKVEATRLTASRIRDALTPRSAGTDGKQNAELELFTGTNAVVTFSTDAESRDLAANIIAILQRAKWIVLSVTPDFPMFPSPMAGPFFSKGGENMKLVQRGQGLEEGVSVIAKPDVPRPSAEAARLLSYILKDNRVGCDSWGMGVYQGRHWSEQIPDDAVQILVGRKPMAFLQYLDEPAEVQAHLLEFEERNKTMSDSDRRDRQNILEKRRKELKPRN
jgi:hypothetical protein